jgi:hypothetical protein
LGNRCYNLPSTQSFRNWSGGLEWWNTCLARTRPWVQIPRLPKKSGDAFWCMPIIPATQEMRTRGFQVWGCMGKVSKTLSQKLGMVALASSPSYLGGRGRRIIVQAWPWQSLWDPSSKTKGWGHSYSAGVLTPHAVFLPCVFLGW